MCGSCGAKQNQLQLIKNHHPHYNRHHDRTSGDNNQQIVTASIVWSLSSVGRNIIQWYQRPFSHPLFFSSSSSLIFFLFFFFFFLLFLLFLVAVVCFVLCFVLGLFWGFFWFVCCCCLFCFMFCFGVFLGLFVVVVCWGFFGGFVRFGFFPPVSHCVCLFFSSFLGGCVFLLWVF